MLTNKPVNALFASITDVFNFYSRNLATNSGHVLIIEETCRRINNDRQDFRKAAIQTFNREVRKRHIPVIEPAKEVAGSRHAWWLEFGRIDRLEGAILGVSAETSQISDARGWSAS